MQNSPVPSRQWTSIVPSELLYDWNISQLTGLRHVLWGSPNHYQSVIIELVWNSHWWFSWKRSHLNILNHPLSTSNLSWNYTSLIQHLHPACRTSLFPCQWFRQQEIVPYFPKNAVTSFWRAGPKGQFILSSSRMILWEKLPWTQNFCLNNLSDQALRAKMWRTQIPSDPRNSLLAYLHRLLAPLNYSWSVKLTGEWHLLVTSSIPSTKNCACRWTFPSSVQSLGQCQPCQAHSKWPQGAGDTEIL